MNAAASALVNGAILSAILTIAVALALRLAPFRLLNAATRHLIWWIVLAITIALPLAQLPLVRLRSQPAPLAKPVPAIVSAPIHVSPALRITPADLPPPTSAPQPLPRARLQVTTGAWLRLILWIWASFSALLLLRLLADYAALARRKTRAADVPPAVYARVQSWLELCASRRTRVRLAASREIDIPVAVGPRRLAIIIPARLLDDLASGAIDAAAFDQIGLHEAAHIARYDDYALLIQRVIEALFALHPVVRWITRQIDLEREIACDDFVVQATGRPRSYASCLTQMVELRGAIRPALVAAPVADDVSHLSRRVETLLDTTRRAGTQLLKRRLAAAIAILASFAWIVGRTPQLIAFAAPAVKAARQQIAHLSKLGPALLPQAVATRAQPQEAELTLEGIVVEDSTGNPLASAELRFHAPGLRELAADLETDREGRFAAPGLPPGDYTVDVSKPNFITTAFRLRVPGAAPNVRLVRYGVIDGQVTDSQGQAVPGRIIGPTGRTAASARISILVKRPGAEDFQRFREQPLDNGHYRIFDLPPGDYAIGLWYSGMRDGSGMQLYPDNSHPRVFTFTGGEEYTDINFTLAPSATYHVSGRVIAPAPARGQYSLALGLPDQPLLPIAQALADKDGNFLFEKVPAGAYDLFAAGPTTGYTAFETILGGGDPMFARARVQVTSQDVDGLSISVSPARSLSVVLRSNNSETPAPGCPQSAAVSLTPLEPWGIAFFEAKTQARFDKAQSIPGLPPGRFRVVAADLGSTCYQVNVPVADLGSDSSSPVVVELAAAGSIRGVLHAPTQNFTVVLLDAGDSAAQARIAFPDAQGTFRFDALRPGRYRIAAPARAEKSSGRWIANLAEMQEVTVPAGASVDVALTAAPPGARP